MAEYPSRPRFRHRKTVGPGPFTPASTAFPAACMWPGQILTNGGRTRGTTPIGSTPPSPCGREVSSDTGTRRRFASRPSTHRTPRGTHGSTAPHPRTHFVQSEVLTICSKARCKGPRLLDQHQENDKVSATLQFTDLLIYLSVQYVCFSRLKGHSTTSEITTKDMELEITLQQQLPGPPGDSSSHRGPKRS